MMQRYLPPKEELVNANKARSRRHIGLIALFQFVVKKVSDRPFRQPEAVRQSLVRCVEDLSTNVTFQPRSHTVVVRDLRQRLTERATAGLALKTLAIYPNRHRLVMHRKIRKRDVPSAVLHKLSRGMTLFAGYRRRHP